MKQPLVNIIIVTYNDYKYTTKCIETIYKCKYLNVKIYLIDNGSEQKNVVQYLRILSKDKRIELIRSKKNLGFGGGCNLALHRINEGYIIFLNNDTIVDKNFIKPIISYMEKHQSVGACQAKIKDIQRKDYFEYAGAAGGYMDVFGFPFSRGRIFFTIEKDTGQYDTYKELVWCSGTAMITKKEVLDKVGYFDEIFFMYGEESDLCWRIHHAGYKQVFIPQSIVYHQGGATMRKNQTEFKTFLSHRNGIILLIKNYSLYDLIKYLPARFIFDVIALVYYLYGGHAENSTAIMKAYGSLLLLLPRIINGKRITDALKRKYKVKTKYPLYKKSIIIDYFFRNKKRFNELRYVI
jgi:GT2 family glycosyltransferase